MFIESLYKFWECEKLKIIANANFEKAFLNWCKECPNEAQGIDNNELNVEKLKLNSINIAKSDSHGYIYKIEAKYSKSFSNGKKIIYILKFHDDFDVFDDALYTTNID